MIKKIKLLNRNKKSDPLKEEKYFAEQEADAIGVVKENPFFSSDKYSDIYAGLAANAMTWRIVSIILGTMLMFSFIAFVSVAKNTKVVPYVIQVDQHGFSIPIKPIDHSDIDNRIIISQIGQFISNARIRVLNRDAQLQFAKLSYRCIGEGSKAYRKLTDYYRENVPTNTKNSVEVQIQSIVPISGKVYNAEWRETSTVDSRLVTKYYKGIFQVEVSPPQRIENLIANPLGIFIEDFQIQEMIK